MVTQYVICTNSIHTVKVCVDTEFTHTLINMFHEHYKRPNIKKRKDISLLYVDCTLILLK